MVLAHSPILARYLAHLSSRCTTLPVLFIAAFHLFFISETFAQAPRSDSDNGRPFSQSDEEAPDEGPDGVVYQLRFEGDTPPELLENFEQNSNLVTLADRPPASEAALIRRVQNDLETFKKILNAEGFYASQVTFRFEREEDPLAVVLEVTTGKAYRLEDYTINFTGPHADKRPLPPAITLAALALKRGDRAVAAQINDARQAALRILSENARPLARVIDQQAIVDHETQNMTVTLQIDPGPYVRFGPLTITGLQSVDPDYLHRALAWPQGEPFNQVHLSEIRRRLSKMNLFESIRAEFATTPDSEDELPVTLHLSEAKHRSLGFGLSYSSDEGAGGEIFWEHRNLSGEGERLRTSVSGTEVRQRLLVDYAKPNFHVIDQTLDLRSELHRTDSDAFDEKGLEGYAGLSRDFDEIWSGSIGLRPEYSRVDDNESGETAYTGLGLPATLTRDTSDDPLDPLSGTRITFGLTPNFGNHVGTVSFLLSEAKTAGYWTPLKGDLLTLAGRGRLASLVGEDTGDIPAHRRIYSGGGGSIRGYEFQTVGPLDSSNDPVGGRSALEVGLEARFRINETYGFVPFIEGGTAYDANVPDFSETILWAAGLGVRYYTVAGPLRFDLAIPLNPRGRDGTFEFYIAFGQAF